MTCGADKQTLRLDHNVAIDLLARDGEFLGLGDIAGGGVPWRNAARPMFVDIRNPWAVQLCHYRLSGQETLAGGGTRLCFAMDRVSGGPMDWQLHECRPYRALGDWSAAPRPADGTSLCLDLRPVSRDVGGRRFVGFSYQYHYRSADIPIYHLLDRGTWEVGGSALGCEFWLRNVNAPPIYRPGSVAEHYATEWYLSSIANPNIFQFLPFQTHLQGFTMTVAEAGVLVTWSPRVHHLRSYFEKPRGADLFVHAHEHCGDLAHELSSAPIEVLFAAGNTDRTERANLHGELLDLVAETLHREAGLEREYVPCYGQIEEWTDADLQLYRREGLPALAAAGATYIELANHFQNDMNTYGVANMCCTVDLKVAETVGEDQLAAFCQDAAARGIRVGMWGNTSISTNTERFAHRNGRPKRIDFLPREGSITEALERAERPFIRNSFGAIESDHYTPRFCALNLRDPVVREYWLQAWRHLHEQVGISGIFLDSSFNLSSDKFDWRFHAAAGKQSGATIDRTDLLGQMRPESTSPASIESQYHAHLSLMREMQQLGYRYCGEDSGVFGMHRNGPAITTRLDNLFMWSDFIAAFDAAEVRAAGLDPRDVFFQGLAYRLMWRLCWHVPSRTVTFRYGGARDDEDRPTAWHLALYRAYTAALPHMRRRRLLPEGQGVTYRHDGTTVLWAFTDFAHQLAGPTPVADLVAGERGQTACLPARRHHVYRIGPS